MEMGKGCLWERREKGIVGTGIVEKTIMARIV
jgi:hypothetical protein